MKNLRIFGDKGEGQTVFFALSFSSNPVLFQSVLTLSRNCTPPSKRNKRYRKHERRREGRVWKRSWEETYSVGGKEDYDPVRNEIASVA